ncbi:MAG: BtpA/SgcQ family protein [Myxococcales bacterium]|nr:BtpA/SgcQ family protein [Myxococcales bacterium]MCB9668470.1 BtpA/SgcQ family protein [Alphaproteobacteria bacterium]MCB9690708.1 BtpA/SgcQ family protein [Alphaproteobacteria bacterium]
MKPTFVGVVHLLPLPGSPRGGTLADALQRALLDAHALREGGVDAVIVENLGDAPYTAGTVDPVTVAAMTRIAGALRDVLPDQHLGINVLRNDALAALSIAHVVDADFVRINVHTGAMVTDQGLIEGRARDTLLERQRLGARVQLVVDVLVKHAVPLGNPDLADVARDTAYRGLADVLVVTGSGTGRPHDPARVAAVKNAVPDRPVWIGSGVTPPRARSLGAEGAIVGTWLHEHSDLSRPVDVDRVRAMRAALDAQGT